MDIGKEAAPAKNKEKARTQAEQATWAKVEQAAARTKLTKEASVKGKGSARTKTPAKTDGSAQAKGGEESSTKVELDAARAIVEQAAKVKANEAPRTKPDKVALANSRTEQETLAKAERDACAKAEEDALAKAEQEARAGAGEEARVEAEEVYARVEEAASAGAEDEIANFQKARNKQRESAAAAANVLAAGFETLAAETIDYSKKSMEERSAFVEKLLGAKSFESAVQIPLEYARRSYLDFIGYLTKIGGLYAKLARTTVASLI